jgi:DNA-binding response OmpR family regulator
MLRGFKMQPALAETGAEAQAHLNDHAVAVLLCEALLPDMTCNALIQWIRRSAPHAMRTMPVIVMTSRTQLRTVTEARDSGASIIVKKPVSARVLAEHIAWAGRSARDFVSSEDYVGPDRRFKSLPAPLEGDRRSGGRKRKDDESTALLREEIRAIEDILALSHAGLAHDARQRLIAHGRRIAQLAGRGGYAHLEIAANGLCDAAAGLSAGDTHGSEPVAVHLKALQLLTAGTGKLTPAGADRVLEELSRMLAHLGISARYAVAASA